MNSNPLSKTEGPYPTGDSFDPFYELLQNREVRSLSVRNINLRTLTPFQRTLLAIDGTVTKYLETYTLEPIEVVKLRQETQVLSDRHPYLETPPGTEVLAREVLLRGAYTATTYAYAVSLLVPARLPAELLQALEKESGGIGRALLNSRIENRREMLWYGREHLPRLPEGIRLMTGDDFLSRAYCIIVGNKPVMLINEKFPANVDGHRCHPVHTSGEGRA